MSSLSTTMPFERSHAPTVHELNELFGQYEFKSLIAVGGMGAVYLAEQKSLDRSVAIKILPRRYSRNKTFFDAFKEEAKTIAKLNHQNLVSVHDFGVKGELPYLVMEYVFGQALEKFISQEMIGYRQAAELILGLCKGVRHAHQKNVVHRDIKPANMILGSDGEVKLVDFGIAKQCGYIPFQSGDMIFGTAGFAAPEITNSPHLIDARSDIYSIGATLCQMVTGYTPDDLITKGIDRRHLLGPLYPIVFKTIRSDPNLRFQSVEDLERALNDALNHDDREVEQKQHSSLLVQTNNSKTPVYSEETQLISAEKKKEILLSRTSERKNTEVILADRYQLDACLRQGSRMMVYKARDLQMNRYVKVQLFFKNEDPQWTNSFLKILSNLVRVEHPNIPKVLDGGFYNAGAFIIYGWVEGQRIQQWIDEELDYEGCYSMALQILDALEVASHYGFHHFTMNTFSVIREKRDFLNGRYLLMDVGESEMLSLIHDEGSLLIGVRNEWAAPELFARKTAGERTSIYIFSQLLTTVLLRGHPLAGLSLEEIERRHQQEYRISIREYRSDLPEPFLVWMDKLIEPNANLRFSSLRVARKSMPKAPKKVRI